MTIQNLFTTPIKIISLENFEEIRNLVNKATSLGFVKNFFERLPKEEADKLVNIFTKEVDLYYEEITKKKINFNLVKSWVTNTKKYGLNSPHDHCNETIIAVFYLNTFNNCGDLLLHDPRGSHSFIETFEFNSAGEFVNGRNFYRITPKTGDLIIFPAYIVHSVEPNMSDGIRRSLAMNFKYKDFNQWRTVVTQEANKNN
jgi:uncharacterized protein (TIGR02466 family)